MISVLDEILNNIEFLEPITYNNISVVGIRSENFNKLDLLTLSKGLDLDLVEVMEVSENGTVGELKVVNKSVVPVLILDGEEVKGAKQNRIANASFLVPPKEELIIPVSCTEQGRWSYNSKKFKSSGNILSYNARRNKTRSLNNSFKSNQNQVWNDISTRHRELNTSSHTGALSDAYKSRNYDIKKYLNEFKCMDGQTGSIIFLDGEIVTMELAYNSQIYKNYHEKILKSVILDALDKDTKGDALSSSEQFELCDNFLKAVSDSSFEKFSRLGLGDEYSLNSEDMLGSALIYDDSLIHGVFFNNLDNLSFDGKLSV